MLINCYESLPARYIAPGSKLYLATLFTIYYTLNTRQRVVGVELSLVMYVGGAMGAELSKAREVLRICTW